MILSKDGKLCIDKFWLSHISNALRFGIQIRNKGIIIVNVDHYYV